MGGDKADFLEAYKNALEDYLADSGEAALHRAYEFGRQAIASDISLLDLIDIHHEAFSALLAEDVVWQDDVAPQVDAAGRFLTESLSPFHMFHLRNQEANAALRRMNDMLEDEAQRVAHALHDQAATLLATVYLDLAELAREMPEHGHERMDRITAHLDQIREQLRRLSHEVRPPILDTLGLVPALQFLADGIEKRTGLVVTVEGSIDRDLPQSVKTTVYRVVQEALINVTRHAQATRASVRVWEEKRTLNCTVRDNGKGFDRSAVKGRCAERGLGLIGMEERIRALHGTLEITSARGQGTTVCISLPQTTGVNANEITEDSSG